MTPAGQHSFGGSRLDRYLFDYETTEAPPSGGDAGADPSPAADPGAGEAAPSAAATDPAPAWTPDHPDFRDAVAAEAEQLLEARLGPLLPALQALQNGSPAEQAQAAQALGALDPFADDFGTNLDQRFGQLEQKFAEMLAQIQQPLLQRQEQETIAEGEQRLQDMLADDVSRNGEFSAKPEVDAQARQLVRTIADTLFPEVAQRYGTGPRAAEVAMAKAATEVRNLLKAEREQGAEQAKNELATLAGVRGEPGTAVVGAQTVPQVASWDAFARA